MAYRRRSSGTFSPPNATLLAWQRSAIRPLGIRLRVVERFGLFLEMQNARRDVLVDSGIFPLLLGVRLDGAGGRWFALVSARQFSPVREDYRAQCDSPRLLDACGA